jgi:hypothetical protein
MSYRVWQPQYAARRIATFPVRVSDGVKKPAIRGWQHIGLPASAKLAERFAAVDAFGFCPGRRSGLTILDVDTNDERVLAYALVRHGPTPIVVRSGSGNHQAWYRHNGEQRLIRPEPDTPIDILGSGFVVAPPSRGIKWHYQFIRGGLDDLDDLPHLRGLSANVNGQTRTAAPPDTERIREGVRNTDLWNHCMKTARHCDDLDALLDVARTRNAAFSPPLSDDEIVKVATSAWGYTVRGENGFGRPGVFFDANVADRFIRTDQDAFILLAFLRANNKPDRVFMVANGLANALGWTEKRVARTRSRLLEGKFIERVSPARQHRPARYRWILG